MGTNQQLHTTAPFVLLSRRCRLAAEVSFLLLLSLPRYAESHPQTGEAGHASRRDLLNSKRESNPSSYPSDLPSIRLPRGPSKQRVLQEEPAEGHPVHSMTVQEYDVSGANSAEQGASEQQQQSDVFQPKADDFNAVSSSSNVWSQFQSNLPDAEAEGDHQGQAATSASSGTGTTQNDLGNLAGEEPFATENADPSEGFDSQQGQGDDEFPFAQEAAAEAQAADAAVAEATGKAWKDPFQQSAIPEELQKTIANPFQREQPEQDQATAAAAAAAASGEPSHFSISKASAAITGAYLNFTSNLNLTGPLNITEGLTKIQSGNVGPEAFLTAVLGTLVGILVCLCCCCLCCACRRRKARVKYQPVSKGDIEM